MNRYRIVHKLYGETLLVSTEHATSHRQAYISYRRKYGLEMLRAGIYPDPWSRTIT